MQSNLSSDLIEVVKTFQKNEITEYEVYLYLAKNTKDNNAKVLREIAEDERSHYYRWKKYTGVDVAPSKFDVIKYKLIAHIFGITFAIKLMEKQEEIAEQLYKDISNKIPEAEEILQDEEKHEKMLIALINEEKLKYVSSMVLGLSDAIVELTGAIAGLTFAFQKAGMVAIAGLITGIAAALSMSASEYLSQKSETDVQDRSPLKASFYTGLAYIFAVILLVAPFFIVENVYWALGFSLLDALFVIFVFTFFISVVKESSFKNLFFEMCFLSFGVAGLSFIIGLLARKFIGVDL